MAKNILSIFIAIYIIVSTMYLGYLLVPRIVKYFKNTDFSKKEHNKITKQIKEPQICKNYALGYINSTQSFSLDNRIKSTFNGKISIAGKKLNYNIEDISCDEVGQKAYIFSNSKLYTEAIISNYEYTSLVSNTDNDILIKTIAKPLSSIDLNSGYIVATYNIDKTNTSPIIWELSKEEEDIILGTCDTIYFELSSNTTSADESEYLAAKTDFNSDGINDYLVIINWYDKSLGKDLKYSAIFILIFDKTNAAKRYTLLPFVKTRKSFFYIDQIVDIDNDGFKEVIVRKNRDYKDSFIIYDYSNETNSFTQVE